MLLVQDIVMSGQRVHETLPFPEELLTVNAEQAIFLQWCNHCYIAHAPVYSQTPVLFLASNSN